MILRHTTVSWRLGSISEHGLLLRCARDSHRAIWLHEKRRTCWASTHVQERHRASKDEIVVLEIEVPAACLVCRGNGMWTCYEDIPWEWVLAVHTSWGGWTRH